MRTPIRRSIIYYSPDPCSHIKDASIIVLYSLVTSYGIRIDTNLYIVSEDTSIIYVFDGHEQRYLHAQHKSLYNYLEKIFCHHRTYPGVKIISHRTPYLENHIFRHGTLLFLVSGKERRSYPTLLFPIIGNIRHFIITNKCKYPMYDCIPLGINDFVPALVFAHYLIDVVHGGWVRRRGQIEWYEGEKR